MGPRFPLRPTRIELGVGLDLQWGQDLGLVSDPVRGDVASEVVVARIGDHAAACTHLSVCWQPRRRRHVEARDYFAAYDDLFERIGDRFATRALHHAALSRRAVEAYRRGELLEATNELIDRYGFGWVSEDVGLWPIQGKPPHAAGPRLNQDGLWAAIRHARVVRAGLEVPLLLDFPSFVFTAQTHEEQIHAYDFFCAVAEEADVAVTLDAAKLISYQWQRDRRGADLFAELEKLPLARCFEIHVSGRDARSGRSFEGPSEILFDMQIELLERLAQLCPNVRVIAYEGPPFDVAGDVARSPLSGIARLRQVASSWKAGAKVGRTVAIQA